MLKIFSNIFLLVLIIKFIKFFRDRSENSICKKEVFPFNIQVEYVCVTKRLKGVKLSGTLNI